MRSNGEYDLHPQEHPIVDKDLHSSEIYLFAFLLQLVSRKIFFVSRLFTISMSMRSALLDDILRD